MTYKHYFIRSLRACALFIVAFLYSCSSTDEGGGAPPVEPEPESTLPFDISVIAGGGEAVYQMDFLRNPENPEILNLTQSLGVPPNFQEFYVYGEKITFFSFALAGYSFWQKDVVTGNSISRLPICDRGEGEGHLFPLTSGEKVGLLTQVYTNQRTPENYLRLLNPNTSVCSSINLNYPYHIPGRGRARIHKDHLYLYSTIDPAAPALIVYNANTGETLGQLNFGSDFRATMSEELLYILFRDGSYKTYKLIDLSLEAEGTIGEPSLPGSFGIFSSTFKGEKMIFDVPYAQPAPLSTAPAIYDWSTNTTTHGGDFYLSDAIRSVALENNQSLNITVARVNLENNLIVAGYKDMREQNKGGVVYLNFDGEILLNIAVDYVPFEILIRN